MPFKAATALTAMAGVSILLAGCSLLNPGPPRDDNGRVTAATTISARDLLKGDCFSFNSADGSVVAEVTVTPCVNAHDYLVIAQGTLTPAQIASASSLQDAVSSSCAEPFAEFKAAVKSETRPEQQFLVFPESDEEDSDQNYSCISTDPDQAANAPAESGESATPEPTP